MAKYDDKDALDHTLHNLERVTEMMQSVKQDKIKTMKSMPSSGQIRKEEIQMLDDGENVKIVFRNTDGNLFTAQLTKEED
tara:strand:- start:301 stop:540 length:240 start_codon:yes stop_codon:yes gene_type:complete